MGCRTIRPATHYVAPRITSAPRCRSKSALRIGVSGSPCARHISSIAANRGVDGLVIGRRRIDVAFLLEEFGHGDALFVLILRDILRDEFITGVSPPLFTAFSACSQPPAKTASAVAACHYRDATSAVPAFLIVDRSSSKRCRPSHRRHDRHTRVEGRISGNPNSGRGVYARAGGVRRQHGPRELGRPW